MRVEVSRYCRLAPVLGVVCALVTVGGIGSAGPIVRSPRSAASVAPRPLPPARSRVAGIMTVNPVFRPLLPRLKGVNVPVLLPTHLPHQDSKGLRLYATLDDRGQYSYLIDIGFDPACHGATACRLGEVTGGPEVDTPTIFDYPRGRQVRLRDGSLALYYPYTCGASCGDSTLVFQVHGVVYTASVKAGSLADVLSMANSFAPATAS